MAWIVLAAYLAALLLTAGLVQRMCHVGREGD